LDSLEYLSRFLKNVRKNYERSIVLNVRPHEELV
jgi:hypothetical protein